MSSRALVADASVTYVALARRLRLPLLTHDQHLARAVRVHAEDVQLALAG